MPLDPRTKMVAGVAQLISERGVGATSVRELAKFTGAPLGSTYHYFPGGKEQLVAEAVGWVSGRLEKLLDKAADGGALAVLDAFIANWREFMITSDYEASCPVLAVATEDTATAGPATAVFKRWQGLLVTVLVQDGVSRPRAERLAWLIVGSLEGAVVMARSQRSPEPLEAVAEEIRGLIRDAVKP
ncbi:TetR/AcrR family transcriptional regulator [Aeromicrobium ginsengisoli]|uniref:TetR/AcrR family transcriptional regulator n=1 Tax=Aeromicrobium ginsengisoli TaxID=363867 RepID=A0A5M4FE15_9ACTN|nr:TetR/AcrR family transcriptional regulator [Aeromicrobium ginsengisoli]KAA1397458.1 TetR/AcrR family transcriptional regulator [Aeromicrobium ginsengisoli]